VERRYGLAGGDGGAAALPVGNPWLPTTLGCAGASKSSVVRRRPRCSRQKRERVEGAPAMHGRERRPWRRSGEEAQLGLTEARTATGARAREGGRRGGATRKANREMVVRWRSTTPAGGATACGGVSSRSAFQKQKESEEEGMEWRSERGAQASDR
jgi:hypothetical protein